MQADEFEKKIQNKMEGFELVPDSKVWEQVSMRIEKEKKKRRVLVLFALAGFALLSATFVLLVTKNGNIKNFAITGANSNLLKKEDYKLKQNKSESLEKLNKAGKVQLAKKIYSLKKSDIKPELKTVVKSDISTKIIYTKVINEKTFFENKEPNKVYKKEEHYRQKSLPPHKFYHPDLTVTDKENKNNIKDQKTNQKKEIPAIAKEIKIIKTKSKKWNFGFTVYSGVSNNLSGFPSLLKMNNGGNYTSPNSLQDGANSSSGNYNYSANTFSDFSSSFSFGLGIFVKKQLTQRWSLSAGVNYHLYKAKSAVGSQVKQQRTFFDSLSQKAISVNGYYNIGNSVNYSNKYQLLELPIDFEFKFNKNSKKPLMASAGISPGYLISTNALYANPGANVYYTDKQQFHRFQLSAQVVFSFPVISSNRFLLTAGPTIQYGFARAAKAVTGTNQHLFFTGIKANINLK